nr:DUF6226 family protein [Rhodococcus qingshengii]
MERSRSTLSRELCDLLDDVAAAFAITGAQTPGWLSPFRGDTQPGKDSYERCTDPEKFLIVVARARAWTRALLDRGWAREASHVRWALRPAESGRADTVLEPSSDVRRMRQGVRGTARRIRHVGAIGGRRLSRSRRHGTCYSIGRHARSCLNVGRR